MSDRLSAYAAIFVGGCIGTPLRAAVTHVLPSGSGWTGAGFPWGTLTVNMVGAFLLGFLATTISQFPSADPRIRLFLGTGILGSFTTYGTFIGEVSTGWWGLLYGVTALIAGLTCASLGIRASGVVRTKRDNGRAS